MKKNKLKAFSFIELMIVVAIISLLSIMSFASLSSNKAEARLSAAQRSVASAIKQAQSYALQGKTVGSPLATPSGFGVCFDSNSTYKIVYGGNCNNSIGSFSYEPGITLQTPGTPLLINFSVPDGSLAVSGSTSTVPVPMIFQSSGTSSTRTVTVSLGGVVTEN